MFLGLTSFAQSNAFEMDLGAVRVPSLFVFITVKFSLA